MEYKRISKGLWNYKLYPIDFDVTEIITKDPNHDYYESVYTYNEEHMRQYKDVGNLRGIQDNKTNRLIFDFDDKENIDNARKDALTVSARLMANGINQDDFKIYFSGNRGFHVEVELTEGLTRREFDNIVNNLSEDLPTRDPSVSDNQSLIRMALTKNQKTGLYKIPLTLEQLSDTPIETIQKMAQVDEDSYYDMVNDVRVIPLPESLNGIKNLTPTTKKELDSNISFEDRLELSRKPPWMSSTKFALQEGFFREGERNNAFMILAATYKAHGFPKEIAWRMLKGVAELQASRNDSDEYSDKDLWTQIITQVYSDTWKGGTYSERETDLLRKTAERFNLVQDNRDAALTSISAISERFVNFAENIDKNTIKTGIRLIDENVLITTGMAVGILGSPGSGKTSWANAFVRHISKQGQGVLYESLDMSDNLLFGRLLQKYCKYDFKKILELIKSGEADKTLVEAFKNVEEEYKNVTFNFKSGTNVEDIEADIKRKKEEMGDNLKLVVVDYLEKVRGPYSDATANSAYVASRLTDLAREYDICLFILLQPQKSAGDPREPLLSMRKVKGASVIEQDLRVIMTMWRPGFNPTDMSDDKFASIAVVKNNIGGLGQYDFSWDGITGSLRELTNDERFILDDLLKRIEEQKAMERMNGSI